MLGKNKKIDCRESLDISMVAELHAQLKNLKRGSTVTFNTSSLERIDTAALQLLTAFVQSAGARKITVQWAGASACLQEAAELLGLSASLQLGQ